MKNVLPWVVLLGAAASSYADTVLTAFTSESAFLAASGPGLDFDNFNSYPTLSPSTQFHIDGVHSDMSFIAAGGGVAFVPGGFWGSPSITSTSLFTWSPNTLLVANLGDGVTAIGATVLSLTSAGPVDTIVVQVRLTDGSISQFRVPGVDGGSFFGVIVSGDEKIDRMGWRGLGNYSSSYAGVDNFYWGEVSQSGTGGAIVPIPSAMLLGCAGLLGAASIRRR